MPSAIAIDNNTSVLKYKRLILTSVRYGVHAVPSLLIRCELIEERSAMSCKPMSASLRWFRLSYEGIRSGDTTTDCSAQDQDRMIVCTHMNTPSQSVI